MFFLDSYDVYDEKGNTVFVVKGRISIGHSLVVYDARGNMLGSVEEVVLHLLPKFEIYIGERYVGSISKRFALFHQDYDIDYNGWHVEGDFMQWDYVIYDREGRSIASISKELFHLTDNYVINVLRDEDALAALMFVLAVDAEKCSRR